MTLLRSVLSWMENLGMIHQSGSEFFRYAALPNFGQKNTLAPCSDKNLRI